MTLNAFRFVVGAALAGTVGLGAAQARANELVLPADVLEARGYVKAPEWSKVRSLRFRRDVAPLAEHALVWPVEPEDAAHSMGNVMAQYQNYGGLPYFHGGCDLRATAQGWVTAPVSGRLEASHYAYTTREDGSNEKRSMPWPRRGESLYFELAIMTDEGYRFEFHHVDRDTLPAEIVAALNRGNARVSAGARIGRVHNWPQDGVDGILYHHIHYNIYAPDGTHLNPEHYSVALRDARVPTVTDVLAVRDDGSTVSVSEGMSLSFRPVELVVGATDMSENNVYVHTPSMAELAWGDGRVTGWDFREKLLSFEGKWPDIRQVFASQVRTPDGRILETQGDYMRNFFLVRLKVPSDARGPVAVRVGDSQGNVTEIHATLPAD